MSHGLGISAICFTVNVVYIGLNMDLVKLWASAELSDVQLGPGEDEIQ